MESKDGRTDAERYEALRERYLAGYLWGTVALWLLGMAIMIADSVGLLRAVDWLPVFMALIVPLALWIYGGPVLDLLGFLPGGRRALWRRRRRR